MGKAVPIAQGLTLEQFLKLPERKPALEYIDGMIAAKVSPQNQHSAVQTDLVLRLNAYARPNRLGRCFVELRWTIAGRSIVPDVVFQLQANIPVDADGRIVNDQFSVPDLHVEIASPDQSLTKLRPKLAHSIAHGCPLGWLIDIERQSVEVYRPGQAVTHLGLDGVLEGDPILPAFRLPVSEIFDWLIA